jgi:electron transfer flavoprotein beta subunit
MKILVCITHVPDTTSKISFKDNNKKLDPSGVQFIIGPYDDYALARAVEIKEATGGTVTVLNVGEADTEPTIRKALAIGADDAIRVNAFPQDAYFVATQIASVAKEAAYDMILMGREWTGAWHGRGDVGHSFHFAGDEVGYRREYSQNGQGN